MRNECNREGEMGVDWALEGSGISGVILVALPYWAGLGSQGAINVPLHHGLQVLDFSTGYQGGELKSVTYGFCVFLLTHVPSSHT